MQKPCDAPERMYSESSRVSEAEYRTPKSSDVDGSDAKKMSRRLKSSMAVYEVVCDFSE